MTGFSKASNSLHMRVALDKHPVIPNGRAFDLTFSCKPQYMKTEHGLRIEPLLRKNEAGEQYLSHVLLTRPNLTLANGKPCGTGSIKLSVVFSMGSKSEAEKQEEIDSAKRAMKLFNFDFDGSPEEDPEQKKVEEDEQVTRAQKAGAVGEFASMVQKMVKDLGIDL